MEHIEVPLRLRGRHGGCSKDADMMACLDAIEGIWQCPPREVVEGKGWVRFCGYEMQMKPGGRYNLRQTSYIQDLLKRRGVQGKELQPGRKLEAEEDESPTDPDAVRRAQMVTGEVMWIATRNKPDIAYIVGGGGVRPGHACTGKRAPQWQPSNMSSARPGGKSGSKCSCKRNGGTPGQCGSWWSTTRLPSDKQQGFSSLPQPRSEE